MPVPISPNLEQLIQQKMATGRYASEEDLLVQALASLDECDDELRAIEEGLVSLDRGEAGVPVHEAFDRLRRRHGIEGE